MNEINLTNDHLQNAELLSAEFANLQLYGITPITYAVVERKRRSMLFAFASSTLAQFIAESGNLSIKGISYVRHQHLIGDYPWPERTLYLHLESKETIALDSHDRVYRISRCVIESQLTGNLLSPNKIWGCSPFGHLGMMLLTERLATLIEDLSYEGQEAYIAHTLWKDYELTRQQNEADDELIVTGEFMEFSGRRLSKSPLVVFDLVRTRP